MRDGSRTWVAPVRGELDRFPRSRCRIALLLLSDGQLVLDDNDPDLPGDSVEGRALLDRHRVGELRLLVPSRWIYVPGSWQQAFPQAAPIRFRGGNRDSTAEAMARVVAGLTGQRLVRGPDHS